jgi:hypothetical protein
MGWTSPRTWNVGEIVTKALMDLHIRDNFRYLKGLDGAVSLDDALILPDGAGKYLHIPILTTTQRDNLTPTAGMMVYNSTTTQFNKYENGAWRADLGFNSAHANLSGLTNDNHTQYQLKSLLTTQGDIIYATGASTWQRLGIGVAGQVLKTNVGATAPEWTGAVFVTSSGTYTGDGTDNRAIAHGLGATPKGVMVSCTNNGGFGGMAAPNGVGRNIPYVSGVGATTTTAPDATSFYVSSPADALMPFNKDAFTYYWMAIG